MDMSLMSDSEIVIAHLFTHNSYPLSNPKYGKDNIKKFHNKLAKELENRQKSHPNVDFLDKLYK